MKGDAAGAMGDSEMDEMDERGEVLRNGAGEGDVGWN